MSGIYIPGMEMPKGLGKTITIYPNGMVRVWVNNKGSGELLEQRAVPVPDHGDLIDRDETVKTLSHDYAYAAADMVRDDMPTIIPAEEGER